MTQLGFGIPTLQEVIKMTVFYVLPIGFLILLGIKLFLTFILSKLHIIRSKHRINFFISTVLFLPVIILLIFTVQPLEFILFMIFFAFVVFILLEIIDRISVLKPKIKLFILFIVLASYFFFYPKNIYVSEINYQEKYRKVKTCSCFGFDNSIFFPNYSKFFPTVCYGIPYACKVHIDKEYCNPQCPIIIEDLNI